MVNFIKYVGEFLHCTFIAALIFLSVVIMSGCESNGKDSGYQFGDITKRINATSQRYCNEQNPEVRLMLKATLTSLGVSIGFDYCTAYGVSTIVLGGE